MATMHFNQARFPLLLPVELMEVVKAEARQKDIPMSAVIREALRQYYTTQAQDVN